MEVDQIQCKFPRISNGRLVSAKMSSHSKKMDDQYLDEEDEGVNMRGNSNNGGRGGGVDLGGGVGRFYGWPSSRIVRVSRASGGKDRHSKVLTSKGLRDRRVRLSVNTAIQFYDLQDRLGYDQPSKAVEWLLKAAESSISELPPMSTPFPDTPKQLSDEKRSSTAGSDQLGFDSAEVDMDCGGGDPNYIQHTSAAKSCSSNSENSKGSGLSLSRSESRTKARERAKERVAGKEKGKETKSSVVASLNPISQTTSFTELLNGGGNNNGGPRQWSSSPMDYFTSGLLVPPVMNSHKPVASPLFSLTANNQSDGLQHFSFAPDNLVPAVNGAAGGNNNSSSHHHNGGSEYNLNFSISSANSSGLADFNRGTLQSNSSSPSWFPHVQRFPPTDGSHQNFFIGAAENHQQFLPGFDARLQLYYGDNTDNNGRQCGPKGKGKN